jgi:hypothetical protein
MHNMTPSLRMPHTDEDLHALQHHQLTASDPSTRLQAQMRRGPDGHIVCQGCGSKVRYGWVYGFGAIVLATCAKARCQPKDPAWQQAVLFRERSRPGGRSREERPRCHSVRRRDVQGSSQSR